MLSFTRGRAIAIALDKDDKIVFTIHITPDQAEPDIRVDNILELVDDADISNLRGGMKLGRIEVKILKQALNTENRDKLNMSEKIKRAIEILEQLGQDKLKKEIDFSKDPQISRVLPLIGARDVAFDRSICLVAPSEGGKTFLAKEICKFDQRKRPVIVFSKIDDDESLRELSCLRTPADKKSRLVKIPLHSEDQLLDLPMNTDLQSTICLFDDIDSFPIDIAQFLREYRDSMLESGRHNNITVISTSHILNNFMKTKTMLNECEWVCLFPASNKRHAFSFLKDRFGLDKAEANFFINKAMQAGRYMCMKLSAPNLLLHSKGVILI